MGFYNDDFVFNERIVCTTCLREMWNLDSFFFFTSCRRSWNCLSTGSCVLLLTCTCKKTRISYIFCNLKRTHNRCTAEFLNLKYSMLKNSAESKKFNRVPNFSVVAEHALSKR